MSAHEVPITEVQFEPDHLRRRRVSPLVSMGVQIALLQDDLDKFRAAWQELVAHPERFYGTPFDEEGS